MPQTINIPGVGMADFPDDATPQEIQNFLDENFNQKEQLPKVSGPEALALNLAEGVVPSLAAAAGGFTGALLGVESGPGLLATGIGGALLAATAAEKAQRAILPKVFPGIEKYEQAAMEQHPFLSRAGSFLSGLSAFEAAPLRGAMSIPKLFSKGATAVEKQAAKRAAVGMAGATGLGLATGVVSPLIEGQAPTPESAITGAANMLFYGHPRRTPVTAPIMNRVQSLYAPPAPKPPAPPEVREAREKLLIDQLKESGLKHTVLDTPIPGFPRRPAMSERGKILVSKPVLHEYLDNYVIPTTKPEEAIHDLIHHESVHGALQLLEGGDQKAKQYWEDYTKFEREQMSRIILGRKPTDPTKLDEYKRRLDDHTNMGHEAVRFWFQRAAGLSPKEFFELSQHEALTNKSAAHLVGIARWMREQFGTEASARQKALLGKIDLNLKTAKKGAEDASRIRSPAQAAELEVRPRVGEETSFRPTGETPPLQAPAPQKPAAPVEQKPAEEVLLGPPGQGQVSKLNVGDRFVHRGERWEVSSVTMNKNGSRPSFAEAKNLSTGAVKEFSNLSNIQIEQPKPGKATSVPTENVPPAAQPGAAQPTKTPVVGEAPPGAPKTPPGGEPAKATISGTVPEVKLSPARQALNAYKEELARKQAANPKARRSLADFKKLMELEKAAADEENASKSQQLQELMGGAQTEMKVGQIPPGMEMKEPPDPEKAAALENMVNLVARRIPAEFGATKASVKQTAEWINEAPTLEERSKRLGMLDAQIQKWHDEEAVKRGKYFLKHEQSPEGKARLREAVQAAQVAAGRPKGIDEAASMEIFLKRERDIRESLYSILNRPVETSASNPSKPGRGFLSWPGRKVRPMRSKYELEEIAEAAPGVKYLTPDFEPWAAAWRDRLLGDPEISKEYLRSIYDEIVRPFLYHASSERLMDLRRGYHLDKKYPGYIPEPDYHSLQPILDAINKAKGKEVPDELRQFAVARGIDTHKEGWENKAQRQINQILKFNREEMAKAVAVSLPEVTHKEGKISWVSGSRGKTPEEIKAKAKSEQAELEAEWEKGFQRGQRMRSGLINELMIRMLKTDRPGEGKSEMRNQITPEDMVSNRHTKLAVYEEFTPEQSSSHFLMNNVLDDESAGSPSSTHRITVLENKETGDIDAVATYKNHKADKVMLYSPEIRPGNRTGKHFPLDWIMERYRIRASILVYHPVNRFHQRWVGTEQEKGWDTFQREFWKGASEEKRKEVGTTDWGALQRKMEAQKSLQARREESKQYTLTEKQQKALDELQDRDPDTLSAREQKHLDLLLQVRENANRIKSHQEKKVDLETFEPSSLTTEQEKSWAEADLFLAQDKDRFDQLQSIYDAQEEIEIQEAQQKRKREAYGSEEESESIESIRDPLEMGRNTMWRRYLGQIIKEPLSTVETEAVTKFFNEHDIESPGDILKVLQKLNDEAKGHEKGSVMARGWRGRDLSAVSAMDKIIWKAQWDAAHAEGIKDDLAFEAKIHGVSVAEYRPTYNKQLRDAAYHQALYDIYQIAQDARRTEKKLALGVQRYSAYLMEQKLMERYGDTARRDIEQLALQKKRAPIESAFWRLSDVERAKLEAVAAQKRAAEAEARRPGISRELALQSGAGRVRPELRGGVTAGKTLPQVPPGPPETLPPELMEFLRKRAEEAYPYKKPLSPALFRAPKYVPPRFAGEYMRKAQASVAGKYPFTPLGLDRIQTVPDRRSTMDPLVEASTKHVMPGEKSLPPGVEMKEMEGYFGVANRFEDALIKKGLIMAKDKGEHHLVQEDTMTAKQIVQKGQEWSKEINAEAAMRWAEMGHGFTTKAEAVFRYRGKELFRLCDDLRKADDPALPEAQQMLDDWMRRFDDQIKAKWAAQGRGLQGVEDIEDGSFEAMRRMLKKKPTREQNKYLADLADRIAAKNEEVGQVVENVNKAATTMTVGGPEVEKQATQHADRLKSWLESKTKQFEDKHGQGAAMAMKGEETPKPELSAEDMDYLSQWGGWKMLDLSIQGELSPANWRKAFLEHEMKGGGTHADLIANAEVLGKIEAQATKFRDAFLLFQLGAGPENEPTKLRLTLKKVTPEESMVIIQNSLDLDPKRRTRREELVKQLAPEAKTPEELQRKTLAELARYSSKLKVMTPEAFHVWNYIRQKYVLPGRPEGGKYTFEEILTNASLDLGVPRERLYQALTTKKSFRTLTTDMYYRMRQQRELVNQARNWITNQQYPKWLQYARSVPRAFFIDKVFGHALVPMITHASNMVFNPYAWKVYFPAWRDMYRMTFESAAAHERRMRDLEQHPHFRMWKVAGLEIEPFFFSDDYTIANIRNFFGIKPGSKVSAFIRGQGFDALKTLRMARAEQWWNSLPMHLQVDEMAQLIAHSVNTATGIVHTKRPIPEPFYWTFFAPKLTLSQWAWLFRDPAKAMGILMRWGKATPPERAWAMSEIKQKAVIVGVYAGMLAMNKGFLMATGSDQDINWKDINRSDFWQFKVAGMKVGVAGPLIGIVRFLADVLHIGQGSRSKYEMLDTRERRLGARAWDYARTRFSPFASFSVDLLTQQDFSGRPLPWSSDQLTRSQRRRGLKKYTPTEYVLTTFGPIPVEEAVREIWREMGMSGIQIDNLIRPLIIATSTTLTGARVSGDQFAGRRH